MYVKVFCHCVLMIACLLKGERKSGEAGERGSGCIAATYRTQR